MNKDMCVNCDNELINIRVGAIIIKDGKILMIGNQSADYLYTVGGRIKFGETAEDAIVREVFEETGVQLQIDRLGFVHENYFIGESPSNLGKLVYEVSFYFYMKVPADFAPTSNSVTQDNDQEVLHWVDINNNIRMFPQFFKTELLNPTTSVKHLVTKL